ncbi:unnamed protein product [Vitrella brassicaformis CCMP3155]|uniref:Nudix hydrolase domain-containing protein n=2 Tax=Vitrella brassicaformis TaxID=1169539 RepID=A0A0G4H6K8_VITBC|nr:unnamed protein product [Vitrella brassicaformis CCMP3155]|mmetsp:Transcript_34075/g.84280  ORF Transcript_34075/g.84280 Transcript_34075/m.84280 type:complete len:303 (+) Transcript_34075:142-1050(+)|eukprot:CEM39482.1 unnamed protein product [Vitrella brassicaformis CCMP3155]
MTPSLTLPLWRRSPSLRLITLRLIRSLLDLNATQTTPLFTQSIVPALARESLTKGMYPSYARAAVSVAVCKETGVVGRRPEYLLIRRGKEPSKGKWSLPGGKIDLGETTLEAAARELKEETALNSTDVKLYPDSFYSSDAICFDSRHRCKYHYLISTFYGWASRDAKPRPMDDALEAAWFTKAALDDLHKHGMVDEAVIHAIERGEKLRQSGCLDRSRAVAVEPTSSHAETPTDPKGADETAAPLSLFWRSPERWRAAFRHQQRASRRQSSNGKRVSSDNDNGTIFWGGSNQGRRQSQLYTY